MKNHPGAIGDQLSGGLEAGMRYNIYKPDFVWL